MASSSSWTAESHTPRVQYAINFYLSYFSRWPDLCAVQETPQGRLMGYGTSSSLSLLTLLPLPESTLHDAQERRPHEPPLSVIGKAEGASSERHGHVTALSVAPEYRRLGLSRKFMTWLEKVSDENYRGFFVDLYVRCVNYAAISMYEGFGYSVYRRVKEYYTNLGLGLNPRDEEDGFGACPFVSQLCPCKCRRCLELCWQICENRSPEILCEDLYEPMDEILSSVRTRCLSTTMVVVL